MPGLVETGHPSRALTGQVDRPSAPAVTAARHAPHPLPAVRVSGNTVGVNTIMASRRNPRSSLRRLTLTRRLSLPPDGLPDLMPHDLFDSGASGSCRPSAPSGMVRRLSWRFRRCTCPPCVRAGRHLSLETTNGTGTLSGLVPFTPGPKRPPRHLVLLWLEGPRQRLAAGGELRSHVSQSLPQASAGHH